MKDEHGRFVRDEESTKSEVTRINEPICSDGRRVVQNQNW
jgi:hypothetical protein